ncbi:MAG: hypothetical protein ABIA63_12005 [bacterium]
MKLIRTCLMAAALSFNILFGATGLSDFIVCIKNDGKIRIEHVSQKECCSTVSKIYSTDKSLFNFLQSQDDHDHHFNCDDFIISVCKETTLKQFRLVFDGSFISGNKHFYPEEGFAFNYLSHIDKSNKILDPHFRRSTLLLI